jgi:hypothetical protein
MTVTLLSGLWIALIMSTHYSLAAIVHPYKVTFPALTVFMSQKDVCLCFYKSTQPATNSVMVCYCVASQAAQRLNSINLTQNTALGSWPCSLRPPSCLILLDHGCKQVVKDGQTR